MPAATAALSDLYSADEQFQAVTPFRRRKRSSLADILFAKQPAFLAQVPASTQAQLREAGISAQARNREEARELAQKRTATSTGMSIAGTGVQLAMSEGLGASTAAGGTTTGAGAAAAGGEAIPVAAAEAGGPTLTASGNVAGGTAAAGAGEGAAAGAGGASMASYASGPMAGFGVGMSVGAATENQFTGALVGGLAGSGIGLISSGMNPYAAIAGGIAGNIGGLVGGNK